METKLESKNVRSHGSIYFNFKKVFRQTFWFQEERLTVALSMLVLLNRSKNFFPSKRILTIWESLSSKTLYQSLK